jgi:hypothetical protein
MRPRTKWSVPKFWRGVASAALVVISGGVLGNLFFTLVPGQGRVDFLSFVTTALIGAILFVLGLRQVRSVASEALKSRARVTSDPTHAKMGARPILIMGLSPLSASLQERVRADIAGARAGIFGIEQVALPVKAFSAFQKAAADQAKPAPAATPWQQNIRAMWFHADPKVRASRRLKAVLVLPSAESLAQFELFKEYARALLGPDIAVDFVRQSTGSAEFFCIRDAARMECRDYESYDYVWDGLERAKEQAKEHGAYTDADICIDATPGQKPFSIAAAIITLNTDIVFSYVTPALPGSSYGGEVKLYDAYIDVTGFSPS